jgi:hypothetical protein
MTQLEATLDLLIERYPDAVSHSEGMDKVGFAFRSRCSDLRTDYGIGVALEFHRPEAQGYYRLTTPPDDALILFRNPPPKTPQDASEPPKALSPVPGAQDAKGTVPFKPTPPIKAYMGSLGRRSGEVRRVNPKYVKVGDRYVLRTKFNKELARKKQEVLL